MTENQVRDRARELEELQEAVQQHGSLREDQPELEIEQQNLQRDFQKLLTPLSQRKGKLEAAKAVHQFFRDLADEIVCTYLCIPKLQLFRMHIVLMIDFLGFLLSSGLMRGYQ